MSLLFSNHHYIIISHHSLKFFPLLCHLDLLHWLCLQLYQLISFTDLASLPHLDRILWPSIYWSMSPTSILIINRQYKITHHWWGTGKVMQRWKSEDSRQQVWRMNNYRDLTPNMRTKKIVLLHVGFMQNE